MQALMSATRREMSVLGRRSVSVVQGVRYRNMSQLQQIDSIAGLGVVTCLRRSVKFARSGSPMGADDVERQHVVMGEELNYG